MNALGDSGTWKLTPVSNEKKAIGCNLGVEGKAQWRWFDKQVQGTLSRKRLCIDLWH